MNKVLNENPMGKTIMKGKIVLGFSKKRAKYVVKCSSKFLDIGLNHTQNAPLKCYLHHLECFVGTNVNSS